MHTGMHTYWHAYTMACIQACVCACVWTHTATGTQALAGGCSLSITACAFSTPAAGIPSACTAVGLSITLRTLGSMTVTLIRWRCGCSAVSVHEQRLKGRVARMWAVRVSPRRSSAAPFITCHTRSDHVKDQRHCWRYRCPFVCGYGCVQAGMCVGNTQDWGQSVPHAGRLTASVSRVLPHCGRCA